MRIQHPRIALFIPLTKQQATSATQQLHTKKSHSPSLVAAQRALPHTFFLEWSLFGRRQASGVEDDDDEEI